MGVTRGNGGYPGCAARWHVIWRFIQFPVGFGLGGLTMVSYHTVSYMSRTGSSMISYISAQI